MNSDPTIAAVVLNWRDARRTEQCCEALKKQQGLQEIFVVDNEYTPSALDQYLARDRRTHHIRLQENRGFAGGINAALRRPGIGEFDYIFIINNDAMPLGEHTIQDLASYMVANPHTGVAAPIILNPDGTLQSRGSRISALTGRLSHNAGHRPQYLSWACVLLRGTALHQVGVLDEGFFMYWEDFDFGLRMSASGWTSAVVESAQVVHELSASGERAGSTLRAYYAAGLGRMLIKYAGQERRALVLHTGAVLLRRLLAGDSGGLKLLIRGLLFARERYVPAWRYRESIVQRH